MMQAINKDCRLEQATKVDARPQRYLRHIALIEVRAARENYILLRQALALNFAMRGAARGRGKGGPRVAQRALTGLH